jgi:hypothetical protein
MADNPAPKVHHVLVGAPMHMEVTLAVATLRVTRTEEFAPALAQREKSIVIEDQELKKQLARLAYLQEMRWWLIPALLASILSQSIAHNYKIDASWHLNWKIERTFDGKLTLTPTGHSRQAQPQPPEIQN